MMLLIQIVCVLAGLFFLHLSISLMCAAYRMIRYRSEYMQCCAAAQAGNAEAIRELNTHTKIYRIAGSGFGIRSTAQGIVVGKTRYRVVERKRERGAVDIGMVIPM